MNLYERLVLPRLTHLAMRQAQLAPYRRRALASARGQVLEIGIGSGLNLPFYGPAVDRVVGVDPSAGLARLAGQAVRNVAFPVEFHLHSAEDMPLPESSFDSVVTTWSLCSIPEPRKALGEARRLLKPDGRLIFVEHGRAPEPSVAAWQDRLTPLWRRCAGGCHLNRDIVGLLRQAGFHDVQARTGYARGPRPFAFMYEGQAAP